MAIPDLDENGLLPPGEHRCTLDEVVERFGQYQDNDGRVKLAEKLRDYLREAGQMECIVAVYVDGSFVTSEASPNDIDLIVVVAEEHDFASELRPFDYNILSRRRVQQRYGFDVLVAEDESPELSEYLDFFAQVRGQPDQRKGILEVKI